MSFKDDLAAAKASVDAGDRVKTPRIPVVVNDTLYEVVFYRSTSADWARDTLKHRPREGVTVDLIHGYNMSGVTEEVAAESARLIVDDGEVVQDAETWAAFFEIIPGGTRRIIEANVWQLNENDPKQEIARAKKASKPRPASKRKPS